MMKEPIVVLALGCLLVTQVGAATLVPDGTDQTPTTLQDTMKSSEATLVTRVRPLLAFLVLAGLTAGGAFAGNRTNNTGGGAVIGGGAGLFGAYLIGKAPDYTSDVTTTAATFDMELPTLTGGWFPSALPDCPCRT